MSLRDNLNNMPPHKLRELAGLCGGMAFLVALVLMFSGNLLFEPQSLKLVLQSINGARGAETAAVAYSYTGSTQTYTVPAGVYTLSVKMWGAGGSTHSGTTALGSCPGYSATAYLTSGGTPGAGGFTQATIPVTPGEVLTIVAGGTTGGGTGVSGNTGGGYSGIFANGGSSAVTPSQSNALAIAGGGGGNGEWNNSSGTACGPLSYSSTYQNGGGGGGSAGGANPGTGSGATQTGGGSGSGTSGYPVGGNGSALAGGNGFNGSAAGGGGGGGGYFGGGGGGYITIWDYASGDWGATNGGGGGSGYCNPSLTSCTTVAATTTQAADYWQPGANGAGNPSTNGSVVITQGPSAVFGSYQDIITSGSSWPEPSWWSGTNNTIEAIGAGGNGVAGSAGVAPAGAAGGCYSEISNFSATPGSTISYQIGTGGGTTGAGTAPTSNTWFNGASTLVAAGASPTTANCVGSVVYAGGAGGTGSIYQTYYGTGGGGGGAGGPHGQGTSGANSPYWTNTAAGGSGDAGSGGAGGGPGANSYGPGAGGAGTEWHTSPSYGSGGGGGGEFYSATFYGYAPAPGGAYGGGGGGGGWYYTYGGTAGGVGGNGIIVITSAYPTTLPLNASLPMQATFSVDSSDTGTSAAIYGASGNPGGVTGALTSTSWASTKTYTFTPTVPGTYTFYAEAQSTLFPTPTSYATYTVTVVSTAPTLSITATDYNGTATPGSVVVPVGGNTSVVWSATNVTASSCSVQKYFSDSNSTSTINSGNAGGTWSDGPFNTGGIYRRYTISCQDSNDDPTVYSASVTVNITSCSTGTGSAGSSCSSQCAFDQNSTNAPATISWCCPSGSTTGSGFSTGGVSSGSATNLGAGTYGLECEAGGGSLTVSASASLTSFTSTPTTRVQKGGTTGLSWTGTNLPSSCTLSSTPAVSQDGSVSSGATSGSLSSVGPINQATQFTLTCGSASLQTLVTIVPQVQEL